MGSGEVPELRPAEPYMVCPVYSCRLPVRVCAKRQELHGVIRLWPRVLRGKPIDFGRCGNCEHGRQAIAS